MRRVPLALLLAVSAGTLSTMARAQDLRVWQGLQEGLLIESAEGDTARAIAWYEGLIEGMSSEGGEPEAVLGEVYYALGRAYYVNGDPERARKALRQALEFEDVHGEARALMGQIDAQELRIYRLPVTYTFSVGTGHWLHSWTHGTKGSIGTTTPAGGDNPVLEWTTNVAEREDDAIQLWFDEDCQGPRSVKMSVRSTEFISVLALVVEDDRGRQFALNDFIETRTDAWTSVDVQVRDFVFLGQGAPPARGLDQSAIRTLYLWDVTAVYSQSRGENRIWLDDVSIR